MIAFKNYGPQRASIGAQCWLMMWRAGAVLKVKATIIKENKFIWTQIFFPCGGMAVVKSLLYVNKN